MYAVIGGLIGLGSRAVPVLIGHENWHWFFGLDEEEDGPLNWSLMFVAIWSTLVEFWFVFVVLGLLAIYFL